MIHRLFCSTLPWAGCLTAAVALIACGPVHKSAAADEPKTLLLIGQGSDGHPAETHEFMAGLRVLAKCLEPVKGLKVEIVDGSEPFEKGPELIDQADGVVLFLSQGARWMQNDPRRYDALAKLVQRGGGVTALHWAVGAVDGRYIDGQLKVFGGSRGGPQRRHTIVETDVSVVGKHPILTAVEPLRALDEYYYRLEFVQGEPAVQPLLTARIEDQDETIAWAWEPESGGRAFGFVGFHFHKNWELVPFRRLAAQGVLWTMKIDVPEGGLAVEVPAEILELKKPEPKGAGAGGQ